MRSQERSRGNVRTLGDMVTVKCALGIFHDAMVLGFAGDLVYVHLPTHGHVWVSWEMIS